MNIAHTVLTDSKRRYFPIKTVSTVADCSLPRVPSPYQETARSRHAGELFSKYETMHAAAGRFVKYCFGVKSRVHTQPNTVKQSSVDGSYLHL